MKRTAFSLVLGLGVAFSTSALAQEPFTLRCETEHTLTDYNTAREEIREAPLVFSIAPAQRRLFKFEMGETGQPTSTYFEIEFTHSEAFDLETVDVGVTTQSSGQSYRFSALGGETTVSASEVNFKDTPNLRNSWRGPCERIANLGPIFGPVDAADLDSVRSWARADVQQVQQVLEMLGYGAGVADGIAGSRTMSALAAFMTDQGLPADASASNIATASARAIYARDYGGDKAEWTKPEPRPAPPPAASSRREHVETSCGQPSSWPGSGSYSQLLDEVMNFDPSTMNRAIRIMREDGHTGYASWLECVMSARQSYNPNTGLTRDERLDPSADREVRVIHDQCFRGQRDGNGYRGANSCGFPINLYYCTPMQTGDGAAYWDCGMRYALQNGWGHRWGTNMTRSVAHFWAACEMDNIACNNRAHTWIEEIDQDAWRGQDLIDIWASVDDSY
jgi:peptidoglycan hydrolase-like protein with peptidoglycan-binding domain